MKILKRPETNWSMKHTCVNCTAELEVEKTDVKWHHYDGDMREPSYDTYTANCAVCSTYFNIPESAFPKAVRLEIQKKVRLEDRS